MRPKLAPESPRDTIITRPNDHYATAPITLLPRSHYSSAFPTGPCTEGTPIIFATSCRASCGKLVTLA